MKKQVILYGLALGLLVVLLKSIEYRYLLRDLSTEVYVGLVALVFTAVGVWAGLRLTSRPIPAPAGLSAVGPAEMAASTDPLAGPEIAGISRREYEVLDLMARGLSNQEIADQLFVSLNTVKKHTSSLFEKLGAKRRTQAIDKAKRLKIIA